MTDFFLHLLLGHLVGDFLLQPFWLALAKRQGWPGLILHVAVVTITTAFLIAGTIDNWLFWTLALFVIHLFIDQFRTFVFTDNSNGKGFILLIADQLAHVLSLIILAELAFTGQIFPYTPIFSAPLNPNQAGALLLCLIVFAIWVVPILEIELTVAVISRQNKNNSNNKLVPITPADRLMGAAERLGSIGFIALGWGLFIPLLFIPRLIWMGHKKSGKASTLSKMGMSFAATLFTAVVIIASNMFMII